MSKKSRRWRTPKQQAELNRLIKDQRAENRSRRAVVRLVNVKTAGRKT